MNGLTLYKLIALVLATNYFAFQVELFEEEYEANHPKQYGSCSITQPTLTWESFDKENAPKAFVVDADFQLQFLFLFGLEHPTPLRLHTPYWFVRDKSPPANCSDQG